MNIFSLVINFILTWFLGLLPAYFIRYKIVKKPISKKLAIVISVVVYFFHVLLSMGIQIYFIIQSEIQTNEIPSPGLALVFVAFVSYKILRATSSSRESNKKAAPNKKIQKTKNKFKEIKVIGLGKFSKNIYILFFILTFGIFFSLFYWFEIRPANIRKKCSYIERHEEAIPARPAKTIDELVSEGLVDNCIKNYPEGSIDWSKYDFYQQRCEAYNREIVEEYKVMRPEQPAKTWTDKATEEEYQFCLQSNGLN